MHRRNPPAPAFNLCLGLACVWKESDEAIDVSLALGRRPIDPFGLRRGGSDSAAAHRNRGAASHLYPAAHRHASGSDCNPGANRYSGTNKYSGADA